MPPRPMLRSTRYPANKDPGVSMDTCSPVVPRAPSFADYVRPRRGQRVIGAAVAGEPDAPTVIGIDLAWGMRAPTGIAVLDPHGRLVAVASVRTDEEIDEALRPWIDGPCLVGLDAPLRVVNPTGRRKCESDLTRAFAGQHAGAYPSNTGLPHFADGGRAARLARRYGRALATRREALVTLVDLLASLAAPSTLPGLSS